MGCGRARVALKLVAAGRAVSPAATGPVPLPPRLGGDDVDVAATLAEMRDEERW